MDYTVGNSLVSSKVIERLVLFYLLTDYYISKYIIYITTTLKRVVNNIYHTVISYGESPGIQKRDGLSMHRCTCKALRGTVRRLSGKKGSDTQGGLRKWLREGRRESSVSRTERG